MRGDSSPIRDWKDRRDVLLGLCEFLDFCHSADQLRTPEYFKIRDRTLKHTIALGRIWKAGLDERSSKSGWIGKNACAAQAKKSVALSD